MTTMRGTQRPRVDPGLPRGNPQRIASRRAPGFFSPSLSRLAIVSLVLALGVDAGGCSEDSTTRPLADAGVDVREADAGTEGDGAPAKPTQYNFASRFQATSGVAYDGQSSRHHLIAELKQFIGGLTDQTYSAPAAGTVVADLNFYFDFKDAGGTAGEPIKLTLPGDPSLRQATFGDVGSPVSLREKMPDVEAVVGWGGGVAGWGEGQTKPTALVQSWFTAIEQLLIERVVNANIPKDPNGDDINLPYVSAEGHDYKELLAKFLLGAVAFSQATDKYLDHQTEGQGLAADNSQAAIKSGTAMPYTALEHAWDEAFGYFGAARDYGEYQDDEIAGAGGRAGYDKGYHDSDGDGTIDLTREVNWGASVNAAKRDRGSVVATDFTKQAFGALINGRHLISSVSGALSDAQQAELIGYRDAAVGAWEMALAATAIHYINDVLQDMAAFGTADYMFVDHAKHWSELKGFALSLQFNPYSPLDQTRFAELHEKLRDRPVLPGAPDVEAYKAALLQARAILKDAYGFSPANVGDDQGKNGW